MGTWGMNENEEGKQRDEWESEHVRRCVAVCGGVRRCRGVSAVDIEVGP